MSNENARVEVPTLDQVNDQNRQILEGMKEKLGMVPNIYATYAHSGHGLKRYLDFSSAPTSLNNKQKEAINLITSQVNGCSYCQAAHTAVGQQVGFSQEQTVAIRRGAVDWDDKLAALVNLAQSMAENRGKAGDEEVKAFFDAGFTKENLVDLVLAVGDKTTTNYLHNLTNVPVDFPEAPALS